MDLDNDVDLDLDLEDNLDLYMDLDNYMRSRAGLLRMPSEDADLAVQNQNQQEEVGKMWFLFPHQYFAAYIFATSFPRYICTFYLLHLYLLQVGVEDVLMEVKDLSTGVYGEPYKVGCCKM